MICCMYAKIFSKTLVIGALNIFTSPYGIKIERKTTTTTTHKKKKEKSEMVNTIIIANHNACDD